MTEFLAVVVDEHERGTHGELSSLTLADLPDEEVLVSVSHSSLNYKDGLAVSGRGKICRTLPMVAGIDLAGIVVDGGDSTYVEGDRVLVTGYELSEKYWGGYSQWQRLKPEWLIPIPESLTAEQSMAIGTAGFTAMLCAMAIHDHGVTPADGPVLVSGAAGGVGSIAIMLLSGLGFEVTACTGRAREAARYLTSLGASTILDRADLVGVSKPLERADWSAAVDCVGGDILANILARISRRGVVAACGLAAGMKLHTTVAPFILRGVSLCGIDSVMAENSLRERAWGELSRLVDSARLEEIYRVEPMSRLPDLANEILNGNVRGRVVIDVNA